jgi:hypothetical protein
MQQENLVMGIGWHSRDRGKAKKSIITIQAAVGMQGEA